MMKRLCVLLMALCLLLSSVCTAYAFDAREDFPRVKERLKEYLAGFPGDTAEYFVNAFEACGAVGSPYKRYSECLLEIETGKFGEVYTILDILRRNTRFVAELEEEGFPSLDDLENYANGRKAEAEKRVADAIGFYNQINGNVIDSFDRASDLELDGYEKQYEQAMADYRSNEYAGAENAYNLFTALGRYEDSEEMAQKAKEKMDRLCYIRVKENGNDNSRTSRTVNVEAVTTWTVRSSVPWITLETSSGFGNMSLSITLESNKDTLNSRTGTLTFTSGSKTATLKIKQDKADSVELTKSGTGDTVMITVKVNGPWKAKASKSWVTLDRTSGDGNTTIKATLQDNTSTSEARTATVTVTCGKASDSVTITQQPAKIPVSSLTLSKSSADLKIGGKITLTEKISPANASDKAVTWSSSNPSVATVSDGVVTAKSAGTTKITVKLANGSKSASCTVTVYDKPQIAFTAYPNKARTDTTGVEVKANVTGGQAPYKYTWKLYKDSRTENSTTTSTTAESRINWSLGQFSAAGTYKAELTVTDALGQKVTKTTGDMTVTEAESITATRSGSGNPQTITVKASGKWTAMTSASWIKLSKTSGTGDATVTATLSANTSSGSRSGTVTFTCGSKTSKVTITQEKEDSIVAAMTGTGNSRSISVKANGKWTATINASWIKLSKTSGTGDATVTATLSANTTNGSRSGTVTFTCGSKTSKVTITQEKEDSITAAITGTGNSRSISVKASGSWTATTSESWIKLSKTSGTGDATVTVTLSADTTSSRRSGTVTFTCGSKKNTIYITQEKEDSITASISGTGNTRTIKVTANGSWKATTSASWIKLNKTSGSGDATITATLSANTTSSRRSGTATFTCGNTTRKVTITQEREETISASVSGTGNTRSISVKASGSWTATTNVSWIKLNKTSGTGDATITATLSANTSNSSRTGAVTFTSGSKTSKVSITQTFKRTFAITSVTRKSNGMVSVKWTDTANVTPYSIHFVQRTVSSWSSQKNTSMRYWNDTDNSNDRIYGKSTTVAYLVPGFSYWIEVRDANGESAVYEYRPGSAPSFSEYGNKLFVTPKVKSGGKLSTLTSFSARDVSANLASKEYGLYIKNEHSMLARAREYQGMIAVQDPKGQVIAINVHNKFTFPNGQSHQYWEFHSLNWYLEQVKASYGSIPTGSYTVYYYLDGQLAAQTTFSVTN